MLSIIWCQQETNEMCLWSNDKPILTQEQQSIRLYHVENELCLCQLEYSDLQIKILNKYSTHKFYNRFRQNDYIKYTLWHEDQLLHIFAVVLYSFAQECCKYLYLPPIQMVYGKILRLALWLL